MKAPSWMVLSQREDLGEFDGDGVEVHAEDVVVGEAHFDFLLFPGVVGVGMVRPVSTCFRRR